jgi:hypothetical protein
MLQRHDSGTAAAAAARGAHRRALRRDESAVLAPFRLSKQWIKRFRKTANQLQRAQFICSGGNAWMDLEEPVNADLFCADHLDLTSPPTRTARAERCPRRRGSVCRVSSPRR